MSADGYYAVSFSDSRSKFAAFHIEAAFAIPSIIGVGDSIAAAQKICEDHWARGARPANNTGSPT